MKKTTALTIASGICLSVFSQTDLPKMDKDTIFTTSGYKIIAGEQIKLGTGTMQDGSFKYIRVSRRSPFNNGHTFDASLERSNSGHSFKIAKVTDHGSKQTGYTYYALISLGLMRYEIDVENAIASGEIVLPAEFKKATPTPTGSTADELIKLKKLLDDGVITKEEFEKQKNKLLNQ